MSTKTALPDTWADVVAAPVGHIFLDRHKDVVRFLIMRGPVALCAYVGVPESHPLAGQDYGNLPVECHGGLTFSGKGGYKSFPEGWWWYGWDYGHSGDYATYYDESPLAGLRDRSTGRQWTPKQVDEDSWSALYSFKKLVQLAEKIAGRAGVGVLSQ
jgi:hypothetical protein